MGVSCPSDYTGHDASFSVVFLRSMVFTMMNMRCMEVLAGTEKKRDAATRNVTVVAEAKDRKGGGVAKALTKRS